MDTCPLLNHILRLLSRGPGDFPPLQQFVADSHRPAPGPLRGFTLCRRLQALDCPGDQHHRCRPAGRGLTHHRQARPEGAGQAAPGHPAARTGSCRLAALRTRSAGRGVARRAEPHGGPGDRLDSGTVLRAAGPHPGPRIAARRLQPADQRERVPVADRVRRAETAVRPAHRGVDSAARLRRRQPRVPGTAALTRGVHLANRLRAAGPGLRLGAARQRGGHAPGRALPGRARPRAHCDHRAIRPPAAPGGALTDLSGGHAGSRAECEARIPARDVSDRGERLPVHPGRDALTGAAHRPVCTDRVERVWGVPGAQGAEPECAGRRVAAEFRQLFLDGTGRSSHRRAGAARGADGPGGGAGGAGRPVG